jgi:hypothetical protein
MTASNAGGCCAVDDVHEAERRRANAAPMSLMRGLYAGGRAVFLGRQRPNRAARVPDGLNAIL